MAVVRKFFPLVLVAAGWLAYSNSLTGTFIQDDFESIPGNPTIRHLWPIWKPLSPPHEHGLTVEGRPIINLSLAINYALGNLHVWGYHALNLTVHVLAGLTLLGVVRRTLLQPGLRDRFGAAANELALAIAIVWTVHPLQTESVTYIIQRAESIMGLFYLLTLYCFIRGATSPWSRWWFGLCVATCALGMASKEVMASAPAMILLYDRAFLSSSFGQAWRRRWPLYLGLASTWILLGWLMIITVGNAFTNAGRVGITWWQYLATEPGVILYYLKLCVWPHPLKLDHRWPIAKTWTSILLPTAVVLALLGTAIRAWKRDSARGGLGCAWGFAAAWFFLILAPSSSVIPLLDALYEHRMYLSLASVVSVFVLGWYALVGRSSFAVFFIAAIGLGILTWQRNQDYNRNTYYNFALALQRADRVQEAIGHYEQALRIKPDDAEAHYNLGTALESVGKTQEAIAHWQEAIRLRPDYAEPHNNLASALLRSGNVPEAIDHYQQALRIDPDMAEAHYNLGIAFRVAGRPEEAMEQYRDALRIKPDYAEAHYNLANVLFGLDKAPEAIEHYRQALRIKPSFPDAHFNLGVALERVGRSQEAMAQYERALQIKTNYPAAQDALTRLRAVR